MGIFSSSSNKSAKEFSKKQNVLAAAEIETVSAEQARNIAAEKARANVFGMLGAPGTYGTPGTPGAPAGAQPPGTGDYYQGGETFGESGSSLAMAQFRGGGYSPEVAAWKSRAGILDPEKYAAEVGKTSAFRQVSGRIAEAEQLVNREGPMWDMLENSTYGVIAEGMGRQYRDEIREIKNRAASGRQSGARNIAREEASYMMAQERKNQQLTDLTFKANIALFDLTRTNQEKALDMGYKLVDNLPEIRAQYSQTMSNLAGMMSQTALPMSSEMMAKGQVMVDAHPKTSILQRVIGGVVGAAQGALSGGGWGGAALGGLLGAMPEANPAIEQGMGAGAAGRELSGMLGGLMDTSSYKLFGGSQNSSNPPNVRG